VRAACAKRFPPGCGCLCGSLLRPSPHPAADGSPRSETSMILRTPAACGPPLGAGRRVMPLPPMRDGRLRRSSGCDALKSTRRAPWVCAAKSEGHDGGRGRVSIRPCGGHPGAPPPLGPVARRDGRR
jgi:hypothetical protein